VYVATSQTSNDSFDVIKFTPKDPKGDYFKLLEGNALGCLTLER